MNAVCGIGDNVGEVGGSLQGRPARVHWGRTWRQGRRAGVSVDDADGQARGCANIAARHQMINPWAGHGREPEGSRAWQVLGTCDDEGGRVVYVTKFTEKSDMVGFCWTRKNGLSSC